MLAWCGLLRFYQYGTFVSGGNERARLLCSTARVPGLPYTTRVPPPSTFVFLSSPLTKDKDERRHTMNSQTRMQRRRIYLNTLVFCLIGGVVCAGLLLLTVFARTAISSFVPLIVTFEIGTLGVVIYALVTIVQAERKASAGAANAYDNMVAVKSCPDYWTLTDDPKNNRKSICVNKYNAPPVRGESTNVTFEMSGASRVVPIGELDNQPLGKLCAAVRSQNSAWSDVQPLCNAYRL